MSAEIKNNMVDDEEKRSLLKELKEMLDKLFKAVIERLKEIREKHSETKMPSVFEAMKQCEEAIKDLESSQEVNTEVVKNLIKITSDLSDKIGGMSDDEIHSEVEKLRETFNKLKADVEKIDIRIKTDDFKKAMEEVYCNDKFSIKDLENSKKQVLVSPDNEIFVKVKDKENEYYARVFLINSSNDRNVKNEVCIRTTPVSEKKISTLVPVEQKENDTLEDVLLRTVCMVNDLQYEKYVETKQEEIEQKKVEMARIEQRLHGGEILDIVVTHCIEKHEPYTNTDGTIECFYNSTDKSFRIRNVKSDSMLVFIPSNGKLSVELCSCEDCTADLTDIRKMKIGGWKNTGKVIKGEISIDSNIKNLIETELAKAYLAYVAGVSGAKIQSSIEDAFAQKSREISEPDTNTEAEQPTGEKKNLYTEMKNILKDRDNCSIDKMPNGNIKVSLAGHEGCYWININNGSIKNYTYQPPKDNSGRKAKVVEIMTGSGKIISQELAGDKNFRELVAIVKIAQQEIEKAQKAQNVEERTNPEDNKPAENIQQTETIPNKNKSEEKNDEDINDYDFPPIDDYNIPPEPDLPPLTDDDVPPEFAYPPFVDEFSDFFASDTPDTLAETDSSIEKSKNNREKNGVELE